MKVFTVILSLLLLFVNGKATGQPFGGGLRIGINASQTAGDGLSGFHKAAAAAGFYGYYYVDKNLRLQLELGYSPKGSARKPDTNQTYVQQFMRKLNYIELPVLASADFGQLSPELGLTLDILVAASEQIDGYPRNDFKKSDWRNLNLNSLVGFRYRLNKYFSFYARSVNSINSVRRNSVPGNVRRYSRKYGEFNDVLFFGLSLELNSSVEPRANRWLLPFDVAAH